MVSWSAGREATLLEQLVLPPIGVGVALVQALGVLIQDLVGGTKGRPSGIIFLLMRRDDILLPPPLDEFLVFELTFGLLHGESTMFGSKLEERVFALAGVLVVFRSHSLLLISLFTTLNLLNKK